MKNLVAEILALAAKRGYSQRQLAAAAGVKEESLSRAKTRGSAQLRIVQAIAEGAGLELRLAQRAPEAVPSITTQPEQFRAKYHALVWSNPAAPDETWIRRALVKPELDRMVDAVSAFGLERLEQQWRVLLDDGDPEARKARPITEGLLRNARAGYAIAST